MSRFLRATFDFGDESVVFESHRIIVWLNNQTGLPSLEVKPGDWKACWTHADRLVRLAKGKPSVSIHESRQRKSSKPVLRIMDGD